nr:hypothetical protein [Tanacetum cinerariifolium]
MSSTKIKRIVIRQFANAIEANAVYKAKNPRGSQLNRSGRTLKSQG